ncbi:MAG: bifunctional anthranilate synthase component II/anthranilate phosphoribosyltransferase [Ruminococcus sp.]|nr:bifunctional anthranilate synthase component II/anthranilate phosphoribosyltransferase [Ruminococcus sp.]
MILLIDNYDSFTYNLYQYIGALYSDIEVVRNDEITLNEIEDKKPEAIIISPGPGYPKDAGISVDLIKKFSGIIPILGVCLGHQSIVEAFGGKIVRAKALMHGKASNIKVDNQSVIFKDLSPVISCARYHSLIADEETMPDCLKITARDETNQIMAVEHRTKQVYGVQFHPESILTDDGKHMLMNFLNLIPGVELLEKPKVADNPKTALCKYGAKVVDGNSLTQEEAMEAMDIIMSGKATNAQIAELLTALRMKGETVDEITGFAKGMRAKATNVQNAEDAIDIVGTGGDLASSFNISTTSSFVISAAGVKVAKHGNRSVSSKSGAADVLEKLGVKIQTTPDQASASINNIGIAFLFAQSYHGSMKYVGPARREMGIRTIFNILGPLANPAETDYIVLGVYDKSLLPVMSKVLIELGIKRAMVVYGNDRLDEISISDSTSVAEVRDGSVTEYEISPEQFGLPRGKKEEIVGGTPEENAAITRGILDGTICDTKRNIVLMNAGCALYTIGKTDSIADGIALAAEIIDSGKALEKLNQLVDFTNAE